MLSFLTLSTRSSFRSSSQKYEKSREMSILEETSKLDIEEG